MQPWKTLTRKTILQHSKYLAVEDHTIELPNGRILENWSWLTMPDYTIVVPVTEEGDFLCFRQTKYAVEGTTLAPIGGYLEPGEDSLVAAKRELREEMGFESDDWRSLGHFVSDGNHGAGTAHLYLARRCRKVTEPHSDDLEEQQLLRLSKTELEKALADGEFKVLAWAAGVALALRSVS
jgi:ADP-ribose pyrophosphatase